MGPDDVERLLSEHINDGVIIQDIQGHVLWANRAFERISGYPFAEIAGRKPQEFMLPADRQLSAKEIEDFRYDPSNALFKGFEIVQNRRKSGALYWAQLSFGFFHSVKGDRVIVTVRDVTDQVSAQHALSRAKSELEKAVNCDALTGLANRRRLMEFLAANLGNTGAAGRQTGLLHIDLDRFKEINDTYGHAAGDAVLRHAAAAMQRHTGSEGLAARIGGDEFIIVMTDVAGPQDMERLAEGLISDIAQPVIWDGRHLSFGYSIGMALCDGATHCGQELIQRADFALYEAKARGRGCWVMYTAELQRKHRARKGIAEDLVRALQEYGLDFQFQPIVDLHTQRVAGIETLARWRHPKKGNIPPNEFLPIAEEMGLLQNLDRAAMKAAALALKRIAALGFDDVYVSFNASTHALADSRLIEDMVWTAAELRIEPSRLAVEVLETVFFAPEASATQVATHIKQVRAAGFMALLDDFGVGYAGLAHLGQLDVSGLKIDRSLVGRITTERAESVIVRAILQLARDLGMTVVAEGVEDAETVAALVADGCALAQGYHFARPMPLDRLETWMGSRQTAPAKRVPR